MTDKVRLPRSNKRISRHFGSRRVIVFVLTVVMLGAYSYQHRPNLYDPARTDLLEASRKLKIYHKDMEVLVQEEQHSAEALRGAIAWLQKAAALDPNGVAEINSITTELLHWEQWARHGELSSGDLCHSYQVLARRVDRLIKKHTRAVRG